MADENANEATGGTHPTTHVREGRDSGDDARLKSDPSLEDAKLDVALDETFPTSDAPSNTQPGKGKDPAPSSGYDAAAEKERMDAKE
ncbi:hypothetical protein [Sphingomonas solaris]|uniref:Uncharacterized protein n=1 Tax=Alterirhizorhabdus solaris TaxID=2529389 RepID=A0A558QZZ6_9SPHN|nr:hypothetical protein [Sphingomonas solaris]TVV72632.1 hypothetical protein FOY91_13985 [Sphingomonas solaris]